MDTSLPVDLREPLEAAVVTCLHYEACQREEARRKDIFWLRASLVVVLGALWLLGFIFTWAHALLFVPLVCLLRCGSSFGDMLSSDIDNIESSLEVEYIFTETENALRRPLQHPEYVRRVVRSLVKGIFQRNLTSINNALMQLDDLAPAFGQTRFAGLIRRAYFNHSR